MNMAGFALAMVVLTSCAGGGNIEGSAAPSRSASQLPTPTVSLPTSTRSAQRPEVPSPSPTKPSPAVSSSRATEEPTASQAPTSAPSATRNPSRSPIRAESTTTQTVTAAPSPSNVTRSVTISPSPSASPSPSSSPAGEAAETSAPSWFWGALAGLFLAAAVATPSLYGHIVDESGGLTLQRPSRRWRGLPAYSSLSWVNRDLLIRSGAAGPSARLAHSLSRIG